MNHKTLFVLILGVSCMQFSTNHKFYVSTTEIDYRPEIATFQITVKVFTDDFQNLLQKRYDTKLTLDPDSDAGLVDYYATRYLKQKIKLNVDEQPVALQFLGKTYDLDQTTLFLQVTDVPDFQTLTVENHLLFELFDDQQNIVRVKTPTQRKSFLHTQGRAKDVFRKE
ncbi:MAG: peptidase E [Flavobacteriaceae bacterium]|nr:peptidase E [Flavobacteriaceae bacterium]